MFFLRSAFWLGVVVMLMPPSTDGGEAPRVTVYHAIVAARALASDVGSVCERNPAACATGGAALTLMGEKAETTASIVAAGWSASRSKTAEPASAGRGTLQPTDVQAPWSAPRS
jgi:hypothetical protein